MKAHPLIFVALVCLLGACSPLSPRPIPVTMAPTRGVPVSTPAPVATVATPPPAPTTASAEPQRDLSAGHWTALFYHERLGQVVLINGGPDRGSKPASDPLELWSWDGRRWTLLNDDGPTWRNWAAVAYDSGRGVLVIHSGYQASMAFNETWEWDGQVWTRFEGAGPGVREGAGMAYDAARGKVVLFGGASGAEILADTWEWDGQTWTPVATSGPSPRFNGATAYDPIRQRVVTYGGHSVTPSGEIPFYGDFWEWDGSAWHEITLSQANPGTRVGASLVPDPQSWQLLMFGGAGDSGEFFTDRWAWDGEQWTLQAETGTPPRSGHTVIYDSARDMFVLFGGVDHPGGAAQAETWEWDREAWVCRSGCGTDSPGGVALDRGNPQRTGVFAGPSIRQLPSIVWQTQIGDGWLMPPVYADGVVYAGAGDGRVYAVEAETGNKLWEAGGFEALESTGVVAGDRLIVGGYSRRVVAFDRYTGSELWSFTSDYVVQAAPLVVDNQVFIATDHRLYALDLQTGQLRWETATGDSDAFMSGPAYAAGVIYTTGGNVLLAVDSATGEEIWRVQQAMAFTGLAVADGLIHIGNFDGYLRAYAQADGSERWAFEGGGVFWSSPAVSGPVVYAGNIDQYLYALNAQTGEQLWSFKTAGEAVSEPVLVGDVLYVSDSAHLVSDGPRHLYGLEARTGDVLWTFEVTSTFLPAPTVGGDTLFVTSAGQIFALK